MPSFSRQTVLLAILLLGATTTAAQPVQPAPLPPLPRLSPADSAALVARFATPDSVIATLYKVISGPAGQERDWDLERRLFLPQGRLVGTGLNQAGQVSYRTMTPEDYARLSGPYLVQHGFFERETHRVAEQFGHVYHAFSTYEARHTPDGEVIARGINSIQMIRRHGRWWVISILWGDEATAREPIPARYGGRGRR